MKVSHTNTTTHCTIAKSDDVNDDDDSDDDDWSVGDGLRYQAVTSHTASLISLSNTNIQTHSDDETFI